MCIIYILISNLKCVVIFFVYSQYNDEVMDLESFLIYLLFCTGNHNPTLSKKPYERTMVTLVLCSCPRSDLETSLLFGTVSSRSRCCRFWGQDSVFWIMVIILRFLSLRFPKFSFQILYDCLSANLDHFPIENSIKDRVVLSIFAWHETLAYARTSGPIISFIVFSSYPWSFQSLLGTLIIAYSY